MKKNKIPLFKQLIRKKLLDNKMRNLCIIIAVVLTTLLFTTAFSSVFYFKNSIQSAELENAGWVAHGAVRDVTDEQYKLMKQSRVISDISYYTHLGYMEEADQTAVVEMQYCEDTMASWMYYDIIEGQMPENENEIVVSTQFLENKGLTFKKGMKLELQYSINANIQSSEFIICGVYDCLATSSMVAFISESFLNNTLDELDGETFLDSALGQKVVEVMFPNTVHMEQYMKQFLEESNAEQNDWILNEAYLSLANPEADVMFAFICVLLLIMLCGYFIIYNIYYISVMQDTRFYGSLVTLGFCGKEIRLIIRSMTNLLCAISIPIGLVVGYIVSMSFLPQILATYGTDVTNTFPNPLIFVFSALFSYFTVLISSRKPSNLAVKISPIEAKNYVDVKKAKNSKNKKSRKAYRLYAMAWKNVMNERKKAIMICCSLSLCIILTSLFYSVSSGVDMDVFLKDAISCDFIIGSEQYFNKVGGRYTSLNSDMLETVNQWEGVNVSGGASVTTVNVDLEGEAFSKFSEIVGEEGINQEHTMMSDIYGLDDLIFQKISVIDGKLDLDKFKTGDYIVAGCFVESNGTLSCYDVGDKVKIVFDNGEEKEYTVLAIGDIPYDVSMRQHYAYSTNLYLPSQDWLDKMQLEDYYVYAYDVDDGYESMWDNNMSKLIKEDNEMSYESKKTYENQLEGYINAILTLGICISIILGVIGLLNFINSIYNSIHNRKRELAIMQSMGMSRNQIYGSLIFEGGYYMLISLAVGIGVGSVLNYFVVTALGNAMDFIIYKGSMIAYILFGIVGGLLVVCIPIVIFYTLDKKEDLLYRLHKKV